MLVCPVNLHSDPMGVLTNLEVPLVPGYIFDVAIGTIEILTLQGFVHVGGDIMGTEVALSLRPGIRLGKMSMSSSLNHSPGLRSRMEAEVQVAWRAINICSSFSSSSFAYVSC
jgi:hypothetical protein